MVNEDFLSFMRSVVLPRRSKYPSHIRLDGARTGGNRDAAGHFNHHGRTWVVHADTHFEPLLIAFDAAKKGTDPFVEEGTMSPRGRCLVLTSQLRARQKSRHKYLYIYSWSDDE